MPLIAKTHHVIAPDFPSFGFTTVPTDRNYTYNFASLATTLYAFIKALNLSPLPVYIFDYGAPIALRVALDHPETFTAIISQNGNAYDEGLGANFWAPIRQYWASGSQADREMIRAAVFNLPWFKEHYETGVPEADLKHIAPESYNLDWALISRQGIPDIELNLLKDYATNVELYSQFQEYFRKSQIPLLAVWGQGDVAFVPEGAEAFKKDLPNAEVKLLDAGHFAVETKGPEIAEAVLEFLEKLGM